MTTTRGELTQKVIHTARQKKVWEKVCAATSNTRETASSQRRKGSAKPENLGAMPNKIYNKTSRIEQVSVVKDVKCQRVRNRVRNDESLDARNCLAVQRSAVSFMV